MLRTQPQNPPGSWRSAPPSWRVHSPPPPPPPPAPGVLRGPEDLGEGLPPPAGRAPAPSPRPRASSPARPARPGMPGSEGRARRGRARPEGAAALTQDSGMRAARPVRITSSRKAPELRSPLCPAAKTPVAGGS